MTSDTVPLWTGIFVVRYIQLMAGACVSRSPYGVAKLNSSIERHPFFGLGLKPS